MAEDQDKDQRKDLSKFRINENYVSLLIAFLEVISALANNGAELNATLLTKPVALIIYAGIAFSIWSIYSQSWKPVVVVGVGIVIAIYFLFLIPIQFDVILYCSKGKESDYQVGRDSVIKFAKVIVRDSKGQDYTLFTKQNGIVTFHLNNAGAGEGTIEACGVSLPHEFRTFGQHIYYHPIKPPYANDSCCPAK